MTAPALRIIFGRDRLIQLRQRVDAAMSDLIALRAALRVMGGQFDLQAHRIDDLEDSVAALRRTLDARTEQQV